MLYQCLETGLLNTPVGDIPVVSHLLKCRDYLGHIKVRFDFGRMNFMVKPGLYAVGNPDAGSPVFVSANYKMSFDYLRRELKNINSWILVLDTKGVNVWCAAGKGTFGTKELIDKIEETKLKQLISHRELIVPQLGATGISAHLVKNVIGFKVIYGPVKAKDINDFLQNKKKADADMRKVPFSILDRAILIPVGLTQDQKYLIPALIIFFILSGLDRSGFLFEKVIHTGFTTFLPVLAAYISGAVLTPLLLPYIPSRAFALKGFLILIPVFILIHLFSWSFSTLPLMVKISWFLMMSSASSFIAMNFTGGSTFTSLTGVKKEMRYAVPLQIAGFSIGFILWIFSRFIY
jgi:acetyl-CoA decarbonylase/synthase complex subunit gamma